MSSRKSAPEPDLIIGYTTRRHLLLDLDNCSQEKARRLALLIMAAWPEVGNCLIVLSSPAPLCVELRYSWNNWPWIRTRRSNYHLVFDNQVGYNKCCRICACLAGVGVLNRDYVKLREFRGDMTLRVSSAPLSTGLKPRPLPRNLIVSGHTRRHDGLIFQYLRFSSACARLGRGLAPLEVAVQVIPAQAGDGQDGQP